MPTSQNFLGPDQQCHPGLILASNYLNNESHQKTSGEVADLGRRQVSTQADDPKFKPSRQPVKYQRWSAKDGGIF
jgi:hypothetical protein